MNFLLLISHKDFGNINKINQDTISRIKFLFGISISISNIIFGFLIDICEFKKLMYIITGIEILISGSLFFAVMNDSLYIVFILSIGICIGGYFSILAIEFNRKFGIFFGPEIYGVCGIFIGISNLASCLLAKFLFSENIHYVLGYLIGGSLCIYKLGILLFFFDEQSLMNKVLYNNRKETESF